jgi:hypothetical protein
VQKNFNLFCEVFYLTIFPLIYCLIVGAAAIKLLRCNFLKNKLGIFLPFCGIAICSILQLIVLCLQLQSFARVMFAAIAVLSVWYIFHNQNKIFVKLRNQSQNILFCVVIFIFIFLTQRFTIGWGIVPLKNITQNGFGMDDTAWHASIAGMFKHTLPIPHPTLCGEILPPSHRMVHCLAAFFSNLLNRNSLDIFFFTIPFLVYLFLVFQVCKFLEITTKKSIFNFLGTVFICLGLNGATLLFPIIGPNLAKLLPEPLPWIFWRLPGFSLSILFSIPLILILEQSTDRELPKKIKYFLLGIALAGGLYSKPAIPFCIIGGYALYGLYNRNKNKIFNQKILIFSVIFMASFYWLFLSAKNYGFDENMPFKPFTTFNTVFEKIITSNEFRNFHVYKIILFFICFFLLPIYGIQKTLRTKTNQSPQNILLLLSGAIGIIGFLILYSPMGAEYQFGLFGIFSLNLLFFSVIKTMSEKVLTLTIFLLSFVFYLIHFNKTKFPVEETSCEREVTKDIVEAMVWLNNNSNESEAFFVNDQDYRSKQTNNALYSALSERQSYISCYRYTPGTYINLFRGKTSPWSNRLNNNQKIFSGDFKLMKKLSMEFNINYLVLKKQISKIDENIKKNKIDKKFENKQIAIFQINKNLQ